MRIGSIKVKTGGRGSWGLTLRELDEMVQEAKAEGYPLDDTRVCKPQGGWKGMTSIALIYNGPQE